MVGIAQQEDPMDVDEPRVEKGKGEKTTTDPLTAEEAELLDKEDTNENNNEEDGESESESFETEDEADAPGASTLDPVSPSKALIAKKEKQRLRKIKQDRKAALDKYRDQMNTEAMKDEKTRTKDRMKYLLKQADIFQHFMSIDSSAAGDPKGGKKKGKEESTRGRKKEEEEDKELLQDEMEDQDTKTVQAHRLTVQPSCIKFGTMRDYQLQGLNWMIHLYDNGINGILADEMGLGKTLQTISLLGYLNEFRGITGPHMVIVPKSTLHNWMNEFKRWCPMIRARKFHGNQEERTRQKEEIIAPGKFDVCVTSYEMVIKEKGHLKKFHWRYIIIDEAHRIKNENSLLSKTVRMMHSNYRLLITGTPLQNNLHELWALLNFLLPDVFSSAEKFDEWFQIDSDQQKDEAVVQLHKLLRPFLLRRVKAEVEKGLPPKKETILKIGLSEMQLKWYKQLMQKDIDAINGAGERSRLLNIVMQLRKCCNHPYLFQGAEPGPPFTTDMHLVENSGKMMLLDKLLPKLQERGSRVLIFSQMTRLLDILEDYLLFRGHQYCRIDGNTSGEDRENSIDAYNAPNSEKFVFLLSTRAGGLGINLYTADIVVLFDSDWNPQVDLQAMDRAHRIGQKKEVHVYRFCSENSIEEKVIEKAYKKLKLDALVIQQGRLQDAGGNKSVKKDDLLDMVRNGADKIFSATGSTITEEDIDAIITKGEKNTKELNDKLTKFSESAIKFTLDGGMSAYDYQDEKGEFGGLPEGVDMKTYIADNWIGPGTRERKKVKYNENEYYRDKMTTGRSTPKGPRLPKIPQMHDFQFFDSARLSQLFEKESLYEQYKYQLEHRRNYAIQQGASEEQIAKQAEPEPGAPEPLSEGEIEEKDRLLEAGFSNWNKREFNSFIRANEKHGREDIESITNEIEGKTFEEVKEYSSVFWARHTELMDFERYLKSIEKGELRISRQKEIVQIIEMKLNQYKNPWRDLKFSYGGSKGKAYNEDEDRFLICMTHKLGYGAWEELKAEIRKNWMFRFDWFIKSRTPQELGRRVESLIRMIEKESE
jgi:SWI/SNF-related matrix-associated actin-dependent regulator of chromatin subfamily A member 5